MRSTTHSGRHRVRANQHSTAQILVAALLVSAAAMGLVAVVAATGLVVAFSAGALTALALHRLRQRMAGTLSVSRVRSTRTQG